MLTDERTTDEHRELSLVLAVLVLHLHLVVALVVGLGLPDAQHDGAHVTTGDELVAASFADLLDALVVRYTKVKLSNGMPAPLEWGWQILPPLRFPDFSIA